MCYFSCIEMNFSSGERRNVVKLYYKFDINCTKTEQLLKQEQGQSWPRSWIYDRVRRFKLLTALSTSLLPVDLFCAVILFISSSTVLLCPQKSMFVALKFHRKNKAQGFGRYKLEPIHLNESELALYYFNQIKHIQFFFTWKNHFNTNHAQINLV